MSLYQDLLEIGAEIDHHESDLYVLDNEENRRIVCDHMQRGSSYSVFKSNTDGKMWMDIPFAYEPYWRAKAGLI